MARLDASGVRSDRSPLRRLVSIAVAPEPS